MAGVIPHIAGTGNKIPVSSYMAGISESYPNVNRKRLVETSINSKERVDFMPTNVGVNQVLNDRYIEFRVNGVMGSFIDLSSLVLQLNVTFKGEDGNPVHADRHFGVVNGICNTLFKSVSVYMNEKVVESNPLYNYTSYIKLLKNMNPNIIDTLGKCGGFYDDSVGEGIADTYAAARYTTAGNIELKMLPELRTTGVCVYFPLLLDISTLDMYLLDSIDLRIRLEMANNSWIINAVTGGGNITISVNMAKLWLDRVTPHLSAMTALNESLLLKPLTYVFQKGLQKTYVIGARESSMLIDQPFGNCIPEKLTLIMVDMDSFSGSYTRNPLYFKHCSLSNVYISVNGHSVYNVNCSFDSEVPQLYYETQKSFGGGNENMISYTSFKDGRTVLCFNFVHESVQDSLPIEVSASLRIDLKFATAVTSPHVIILTADTTGLLNVDGNRQIQIDVRG